jgi:protocatechuate 3,4-dioxygenase beta subunit
MTDQQILEVLAKAATKTCGRFSPEQLERPMVKEIPLMLRPHKFFLSAFIPAFFIANAGAQSTIKGKIAIPKQSQTSPQPMIMGLTIPKIVPDIKVAGKVMDEKGNPLNGVSVNVKDNRQGTVTDAQGKFTIDYSAGDKDIIVEFSYAGFATKEVEVIRNNTRPFEVILEKANTVTLGEVVVVPSESNDNDSKSSARYNSETKRTVRGRVMNEAGEPVPFASIQLNPRKTITADDNGVFNFQTPFSKKHIALTTSSVGFQTEKNIYDIDATADETLIIMLKNNAVLSDVSVSCSPATALTGMVGGLSIVTRVTSFDTAHTIIQKVFNNEMFKAYPNPAEKGSSVNLIFKKAGNYTVQIFDNAGKLYLSKEFKNILSKQTESLTLEAIKSSGSYFIKAINNDSNKQFVDKLLVR